MIQLERKYHFYAAHRNPEAGEKCGRIHGHTYKVIVTLEFEYTKENGVTMLFDDVDKTCSFIIKKWDHYFIIYKRDPLHQALLDAGEKIYTVDFITSAENLAQDLYEWISHAGLPIVKLQLMETESSNIIIYNHVKR